jgi:hypothetical protein
VTTHDVRAHLRESYDIEVSPDLISRVTDAVVDELAGRPELSAPAASVRDGHGAEGGRR